VQSRPDWADLLPTSVCRTLCRRLEEKGPGAGAGPGQGRDKRDQGRDGNVARTPKRGEGEEQAGTDD